MTEEKTVEKDSTSSDQSFEDFVVRRNARDEIKNAEWTEARIKDVQIYRGYEFADARAVQKDNVDTIIQGGISEQDDPIDAFSEIDMDKTDSYKSKTSNFKDTDGSFIYKNRKYLYRRRKMLIITVESPDGTYEDEYMLTREMSFGNNSIESIYKEIQEDNVRITIGSPPNTDYKCIRINGKTVNGKFGMWMRSIFRLGSLGAVFTTGLLTSFAMLLATGSLFFSFLSLTAYVMTLTYLQRRMYRGWYEVVPIEWTDKIPEDAKITGEVTSQMNPENFNSTSEKYITEADASVEEDGTLVIENSMGTWTFDSQEEGIPSDQAMEIYKSYGGFEFSDRDSISIEVQEYDPSRPLGNNEYISDNKEWTMKPDGL